jgi:hypothetical protein
MTVLGSMDAGNFSTAPHIVGEMAVITVYNDMIAIVSCTADVN